MSSSDSPSLSPSSLPRASLRSSPFSILPPELTQMIIERSIPPTLQTSTYSSRQSTLRSLCLVSKSFHHFARPLLFATLWMKRSTDRNDWKKIHAAGDDKLLLREVIFDYTREKLALDLDLVGYVGLRTLVVSNCGNGLEFSALNCVPQLSILRISDMEVSAPRAFCLPKLCEMSLLWLDSIGNLAQILNPSSLPSLRLLAYYNVERPVLLGIGEALSLLLNQLHAIFLDFSSISHLTPELIKKLSPITLFHADTGDVEDTIPISHLRFDLHPHPYDLVDARTLLSQTQFSLPLTVYFPLSASPNVPDNFHTASERRKLHETCTERGIEVVYEDSPEKWYLDSGFSKQFLEGMREERRKRGVDV